MASKRKVSYEEGMETLERLIAEIGAGRLSLEESMKAYEKGMELIDKLTRELEHHRRRIEQIDAGTSEITPLGGEEESVRIDEEEEIE